MGSETYALPTSAAAQTGPGIRTAPVPSQPDHSPSTWLSAPSGEYRSTPTLGSRPEPRLRQLVGVCGWAAVLGGIGLVLGIRALIGQIYGTPPGWYQPGIVLTGLVGIGLTVGAFLTVHHLRRPWWLLGSASVMLIAGMVLTSMAF